MPEVTRFVPGAFCWVELSTTDQQAAKSFYMSLFDWEVLDRPIGGGSTYSLMHKGGKNVAALCRLQKEMEAKGVPPHWMTYVSVSDADKTVRDARALGAQILAGPFDVSDSGRMAVIQDPGGAVISIWQARQHRGVDLVNEIGTMCWAELQTHDIEVSRQFYVSLFGWTTKDSPEYVEFQLDGTSHAGMMKIRPEWGSVPPNWSVYFLVADCDSAVADASALGGSIRVPPMDIPGVGRFAVLADPQGAYFDVIALKN